MINVCWQAWGGVTGETAAAVNIGCHVVGLRKQPPAECHQQHCKHHSDSGQQVSSLPDIAREVTAVCVLKFDAFSGN
jgi:hypothetical protein